MRAYPYIYHISICGIAVILILFLHLPGFELQITGPNNELILEANEDVFDGILDLGSGDEYFGNDESGFGGIFFQVADYAMAGPAVSSDGPGTRGGGLKNCCCDVYHNGADPDMSRMCEKPYSGTNVCYPTRIAESWSQGTTIKGIYHDNVCDAFTTMCSPWSTDTIWDIDYDDCDNLFNPIPGPCDDNPFGGGGGRRGGGEGRA